MPAERVQRALARAGFGSRRASEDLIVAGRVQVNGRVATLGDRVDPTSDEVRVDGRRVSVDPALRYLALHKPRGVTATMRDPHAERDLRRFLPAGPRVFAVGRLDRDTEGLLLLTNDGDLAHRLAHPRHGVEKEYLAEVDGSPTDRRLARLRRGVPLDDGMARALRAAPAGRSGGRGAVRLVLAEGRKREVRRMLEAVGLPVRRLVRTRVGPVRLGSLRPGAVRDLTPDEVRGLYRVAGLKPVARAADVGGGRAGSVGDTRVRAARGAIRVGDDTTEDVLAATERLLSAMFERNDVDPDDIVSIFFTATGDLRSVFPAEAARRMGLGRVPLMCAQEIPVAGSMPRVVRILMHFHTLRGLDEISSTYLDGAESLRDDLG